MTMAASFSFARCAKALLSFALIHRLPILSSKGGSNANARWFQGDNKESINNKSSKSTLLLEDVSQLLRSSFGITDLCHPTSDRYAPVFPKCSEITLQQQEQDIRIRSNTDNTISLQLPGQIEPVDQNPNLLLFNNTPISQEEAMTHDSIRRKRRRLEQDEQYSWQEEEDEEEEDRWTNYYDYIDDYVEPEPEPEEVKSKWFYIMHILGTMSCVMVGAMASGLYIGLLSLDPLLLVIKARTAKTETERIRSERVLTLLKQRHSLIVTLLVANAAATEAMPIFLENLVHESVAILISMVFVLLFGEILVSQVFSFAKSAAQDGLIRNDYLSIP